MARFSQSLSLTADLTGKVPLALEIGAIFRFPDETGGPTDLSSMVDVSIRMVCLLN